MRNSYAAGWIDGGRGRELLAEYLEMTRLFSAQRLVASLADWRRRAGGDEA